MSDSDSLVERVARAIAGNPDGPFYFDEPPKDHGPGECEDCDQCREKYRQQARAALEAMRKPDKAMLNAACAAMSPGKRPTQKRVSVKAKHGIRYRAMIDAALKESP